MQEAYKWVEKIESGKLICWVQVFVAVLRGYAATWRSPFSNASIIRAQSEIATSKLAASRAYNLSLAPTLLYTRSALLPILVSSRAHQQLEFQAVGSWFVYGDQEALDGSGDDGDTPLMKSTLVRVPNGREDIFADRSLTLKAKGSLMKFLRFVAVYEEKVDVWEPCKDMPFPDFLSQHFGLPIASHGPLLALSLTSSSAETTLTGFALPRIARHLRSIGLFGPGFGSVIPKWGGLSEVAQVACRAGAVGGAVYVLSKPVESIDTVGSEDEDVEEIPRPELSQEDISKEVSNAIGASNFKPTDDDSLEAGEKGIKEQSLEELLAAAGYSIGGEERPDPIEPAFAEAETHLADTIEPHRNLSILLGGGDHVTADYVIGTTDDLPEGQSASTTTTSARPRVLPTAISRSVSIVTSSLPALYPPTAEGGVTPAGAVVVFPPGSLKGVSADAPVHIIAHASDTGECPQGSSKYIISLQHSHAKWSTMMKQRIRILIYIVLITLKMQL